MCALGSEGQQLLKVREERLCVHRALRGMPLFLRRGFGLACEVIFIKFKIQSIGQVFHSMFLLLL